MKKRSKGLYKSTRSVKTNVQKCFLKSRDNRYDFRFGDGSFNSVSNPELFQTKAFTQFKIVAKNMFIEEVFRTDFFPLDVYVGIYDRNHHKNLEYDVCFVTIFSNRIKGLMIETVVLQDNEFFNERMMMRGEYNRLEANESHGIVSALKRNEKVENWSDLMDVLNEVLNTVKDTNQVDTDLQELEDEIMQSTWD